MPLCRIYISPVPPRYYTYNTSHLSQTRYSLMVVG